VDGLILLRAVPRQTRYLALRAESWAAADITESHRAGSFAGRPGRANRPSLDGKYFFICCVTTERSSAWISQDRAAEIYAQPTIETRSTYSSFARLLADRQNFYCDQTEEGGGGGGDFTIGRQSRLGRNLDVLAGIRAQADYCLSSSPRGLADGPDFQCRTLQTHL
jgi:hypothetical protein